MEISTAQRRILNAAVDAFAEQGFGGTSTRDIAERAGRSQAALYIHYSTKESVLHAVSLAGHRESLDCLTRAAASSTDPAERLHRMVFDFTMWHMDNARLARVVQYELHALSSEHRTEVVALRRHFQRLMVDALRAGLDADRFDLDHIDGTARALLSLCIDLERWFDPELSRDRQAIALLNADLSLRIVRATPAPSEGAQR